VLTEDKSIIDPTATDAQKATTQVSIDKWVKANKISILIIKSSKDPTMSGGISEKVNAKDLLAVIKHQFERSVKSRQYSCLCQLLSLKYDESENVKMHIFKIFKLVLQLRELGLSIDDTLMVHLVVFSLPKSFEMFQVHY